MYKIEYVNTDALIVYDKNAKKHPDVQVDRIVNSIQQFGFRQNLVIDKNNVVIIGHGRLLAARKMGLESVPCMRVEDLSDEQIKALRLADNRVAESDWDDGLLKLELDNIVNLDMSDFGFEIDTEPNEDDENDLDDGLLKLELDNIVNLDMSEFGFDLSDFLEETKVIEDDFDEEPPENPKSKSGDIFQLGKHRLMCGDSTSPDDFDKLMNGQTAVLTVTSPPYGVGKSYEKKGIEAWFETMRPVIDNVTRYSKIVCWNLGDLYSTGGQFIEPTSFYSMQMFAENGFKPIWIRIWEKQGMNFGNAPYHLVSNKPVQQYEYISAFASEDGIEPDTDTTDYMWLMSFAGHGYKFVKRLSRDERREWGYAGIWKINTVTANKEHPAMFPVELPWRCIKMHTDEGNIVLEPFDGSGTTIIACEQLNRPCYAMERDPRYVDLAISRWEAFTGEKAVLLNRKE